MLVTFGDIVTSPNELMGVKAVFGPANSHLLRFGGRGSPSSSGYYSVPRSAATKATTSPFIVAIGGGKDVRDNLGGKVLNLFRAGTVYGTTSILAGPEDKIDADGLARWPVALVMRQVWEFDGFPHLVDELGMPDRKILAAAMDGIVRPPAKIDMFWEALKQWPLREMALRLPANFHDNGVPKLVTSRLPTIPPGVASEEGKRVWQLQLTIERDSKISKAAKLLNIERYGAPTCESCQFTHSDSGMFDAHHPTPLAAGQRNTLAEHLIILCPTCHRRAHRRDDKLSPYNLLELKTWIASGRP